MGIGKSRESVGRLRLVRAIGKVGLGESAPSTPRFPKNGERSSPTMSCNSLSWIDVVYCLYISSGFDNVVLYIVYIIISLVIYVLYILGYMGFLYNVYILYSLYSLYEMYSILFCW